jgi:hypothetical protein
MITHLALVSETEQVKAAEVAKVSAALQKQLTRDFAPIWGMQATIDAFESLDDIPPGYWPVVVIENVPGSGTHKNRNGQPYALVEAGPTWSLAASHEVLEMLVDPFASRLVAGQSPDPHQGRVEFLVEVCDPCQDGQHAYACNGFLVSDFFTPNYFDPVSVSTVRYSFTGAIRNPRDVLRGGCLSWREPTTGNWHQLNWFHEQRQIKNLGPIPTGSSLRSAVDTITPRIQKLSKLDAHHDAVARALASQKANNDLGRLNAQSLREMLKIDLKRKDPC